ncbi:MAG: DUF445 domain-containing protein [Anaerovoracaceae bacterium]
MIWKLIAAPVIGAIIGYCTNWLAVKMLFRPRKAMYIGKFHVPFTPGVIPKGKKRLAGAVSQVLNEQLLTEEVVKQRLLDPQLLFTLRSAVRERMNLLLHGEPKTLRELLEDLLRKAGGNEEEIPALAGPGSADSSGNPAAPAAPSDEEDGQPEAALSACAEGEAPSAGSAGVPEEGETEASSGDSISANMGIQSDLKNLSDIRVREEDTRQRLDRIMNQISDFMTARIYEKVCSMDLGKMAADTIIAKVSEALAGSFLGQMMGGPVVQSMAPAIAQTVDGYIAENGEDIIGRMVREEIDSLQDMDASKILEQVEKSGVDPGEKAVELYTHVIEKNAGKILQQVNVGDIARQVIEDMDNEQLEKLVLSTMKTELGAIVNLGALIGLVLGLINMAIYLI